MKFGVRTLPRPPWWLVALSVGLAVAMSVYALKVGWPLRYVDEKQYLEIAQNLVAGKGYEKGGAPTAYRPPGWVLVLALLLVLKCPLEILPLVVVLFTVAAALLAGAIAARLSDSTLGWLATPAVLIYPLNFYAGATLYPQSMSMFLILALWAAVIFGEPRTGRTWDSLMLSFAVGFGSAALVLTVPTMSLAAGIFLLWRLWQVRRSVMSITVGVVGLVMPLAAWMVRNHQVMHAFIPVSTTSGENLLLGNSPNATAWSGTDVAPSAYGGNAGTLGEVDRDDYFRTEALRWIGDDPARAGWLFVQKTVHYFAGYDTPASGRPALIVAAVGWAGIIVLLLAFAARLALKSRMPLSSVEFCALFAYFLSAPFMAIFFTRVRFRQPLDSVLIVELVLVMVILVVGVRRTTRAAATGPQDAVEV